MVTTSGQRSRKNKREKKVVMQERQQDKDAAQHQCKANTVTKFRLTSSFRVDEQ